jgi:CBS-domain-containing membrane protein
MNRLQTLKVRDVMNRRVVTINQNATMCDAARVLRESRVSGAPVVDEQGRLVGVLSNADFLPDQQQDVGPCEFVQDLVQDYPGGPYHVEEHHEQLVKDAMSTAVQTMSPDTSLTEAAKCLCVEHIHRVIVVGPDARPLGVLTSLDIVAALVKVIEEVE